MSGQRELSVLFADLQGFTTFSENHEPAEVTAMLNTYFEVVVPPVVRGIGGDVDRIIGDALMVTFNKRGDQPDHAAPRRRGRAGVAGGGDGGPGGAPGVAAVPGRHQQRARLGQPARHRGRPHAHRHRRHRQRRLPDRGQGPRRRGGDRPGTKALLPDADTESLGLLELKGKAEPLEVYRLVALARE